MNKKPTGRPTIYSQELADLICQRIATNDIGLLRLCAKYDDMPHKDTINEWRYKYPEFSAQYAKAKQMQADLLAESIDDLAHETSHYIDSEGNSRIDTGFIASQRLKIDSRKWIASKLMPKVYGLCHREINASESLPRPMPAITRDMDPIEAAKAYQQIMLGD